MLTVPPRSPVVVSRLRKAPAVRGRFFAADDRWFSGDNPLPPGAPARVPVLPAFSAACSRCAACRMRAHVSRRFFPCPRLLPSRANRLFGRAPDGSEPTVEFRGAFEQAESAEFAETRGAFPITMFAWRKYREKRHAGGLRGEGIVDIVAEVERRGGIASLQNLVEAIGERLFRRVIHGDDGAEMPRGGPGGKRVREFLAGASREQIQFVAGGPAFDLALRDDHSLVRDIARPSVGSPIKFLELGARFGVGSGAAESSEPA